MSSEIFLSVIAVSLSSQPHNPRTRRGGCINQICLLSSSYRFFLLRRPIHSKPARPWVQPPQVNSVTPRNARYGRYTAGLQYISALLEEDRLKEELGLELSCSKKELKYLSRRETTRVEPIALKLPDSHIKGKSTGGYMFLTKLFELPFSARPLTRSIA